MHVIRTVTVLSTAAATGARALLPAQDPDEHQRGNVRHQVEDVLFEIRGRATNRVHLVLLQKYHVAARAIWKILLCLIRALDGDVLFWIRASATVRSRQARG